jgi:hypothetical protein
MLHLSNTRLQRAGAYDQLIMCLKSIVGVQLLSPPAAASLPGKSSAAEAQNC